MTRGKKGVRIQCVINNIISRRKQHLIEACTNTTHMDKNNNKDRALFTKQKIKIPYLTFNQKR